MKAPKHVLRTRRQFLQETGTLAGAATLGLAFNSRSHAQTQGANNRLVFGLIGCGNMGRENLRHFLKMKDVAVAGVCDVDQTHLDHAVADVTASGRPAPKRFKDFRQLLDQHEIDAVIIGTPDHWHALTFIAACEAGKDIYCEKPISHSLLEAKAMMAAARHFNRVVQIGT